MNGLARIETQAIVNRFWLFLSLVLLRIFEKRSKMKNYLVLLVALFLPLATVAAGQEITVNTTIDFLNALGSNRTIIVKQGEYDLSAHTNSSGASHYFRNTYDGAELVFEAIENLTIRGAGSSLTHFITRPSYGNVFVLEDCSNIRFEGLKAGHGPEKGYCTGGVIQLEGRSEIEVNNCLLYGSGVEGITAHNSFQISLNNTLIQGCTYGIFTLVNCENVNFNACKFFDNVEFEMVNILNCKDISLKNCKFRNNHSSEEWVDQRFIKVEKSQGILFKKCLFEKNSASYFANEAPKIELKKCKMLDNKWGKGEYFQE